MHPVAYLVSRARNGVILDTNVFLAFLVGTWNPAYIEQFDRTASYTEDDLEAVTLIVSGVRRFVTTPHILTEVCNLTNRINREFDLAIYRLLAELQAGSKERRIESQNLMRNRLFFRLGLADMSLIEAATKDHLVVTDDLECHDAIVASGGLAININHIRS